jgi:hypothetical protein
VSILKCTPSVFEIGGGIDAPYYLLYGTLMYELPVYVRLTYRLLLVDFDGISKESTFVLCTERRKQWQCIIGRVCTNKLPTWLLLRIR